MTRSLQALLTVSLAATCLSLACGGDGGTPPSTTAIAKASGDAQTAVVAQALTFPLEVSVTDAGAPAAGVTVTWGTTSGGTLTPTSSVTDASGIASTNWTLGTTSGSQQATASVSGVTGSPVTFTATAEPDVATTLSDAGGNNQTGVINTPLPVQAQAKVADQFGNGIPGVAVGWSATNATVSSASVPTDASGISAVTVTLGPAEGAVTVTAEASGLDGSPLAFTETAALEPPIPTTASVRVANIFFESDRNGTSNPAVDTVAVGGTVTWNWAGGSHNVQSIGSPSFTDSPIKNNAGSYSFTFSTAGTYSYNCIVHGNSMTGRVVVR